MNRLVIGEEDGVSPTCFCMHVLGIVKTGDFACKAMFRGAWWEGLLPVQDDHACAPANTRADESHWQDCKLSCWITTQRTET
eukprot:3754583-Amphidinium_carterae.1